MAGKKEYTPQEAAIAILKKCQELYSVSVLAKANTAHEIETGGEPNNDEAECPEQLASGEVTKEGSFGGDKDKKKKKADGSEESSESDVSEEESSAMEEVAEEEVEEHNDQLHEGADHKDNSKEEDEEKKNKFEKSERPLKSFMEKRLKKSLK